MSESTKKKNILFLFAALLVSACNKNPNQLFQLLTSEQTGISFSNEVHESDTVNVFDYFYVYNGAGVAVGDVNNDGLDDIFFSANNKGKSKLYLNQGNLKFRDITKEAGLGGQAEWSTGVTMVDINADGWLDIYVTTVNIKGIFDSRNELYVNNKNNTFSESAKEYGLDFATHGTQTIFFDYDNDDLLDCFVLNHSINNYEFYKPSVNRAIVDSLSGDKLFHAQRIIKNGVRKIVYAFIPPAKSTYYSSALSYGLGVAVGDLNNDNWLDVYATNDFRENDYCYINNKNGTFTDKGNKIFGHHSRFSMGCDMADYNNDGWLDLVTLDMLPQDEKILKSSIGDDWSDVYDYKKSYGFYNQYSRNCLQTNLQSGDSIFFSDVGLQAGVEATDWSWAPLLADFDDDGNKDLFISNGYLYRTNDLDFNKFISSEALKKNTRDTTTKFLDLVSKMPSGKVHDYIFKGTGADQFFDKSMEWGFRDEDLSHGAAYSDLDNDGDLDLIINRMNQPAALYENKSDRSKSNTLSIQLKGNGGNTFGLGASVYTFSKGQFQMLQQMPTRGFMSSVSPTLHIGLGNAKVLDSVLIIWPSGKGEVIKKVKSNQTIKLSQNNATRIFQKPIKQRDKLFKITDVSQKLKIDWKHEPSAFSDFAANPFLLHKVSSQGLKMAVAEVNGDGDEDIFIQHSIHSPVYDDNNRLPKFNKHDSSILYTIKSAGQIVDALFFDADNDGDNDLITVSGGNQFFGADDHLKDHLYRNDGEGNFADDYSFPSLYENKSCVKACDFDNDGDLDLFIGGRVNARMYGMMPGSTLLQNDGRGNFKPVTETLAPELSFVGMTTDAVWQDVDKDGWSDLLIVGEFMPITFFKNKRGKLKKEILLEQPTHGLWNCIEAIDYDADGDKDFLVGNWGTNSKLKADAENPLKLYMVDYDNNGDYDPLLCIFKEGNYYPFLNKEDLEKRLPILKKKYLKYSDMAGKTAEQIFGGKLNDARVLEVSTLQSGLLKNDNGKISLHPLPADLQKAPIFSFEQIDVRGQKYLLAGGNFYGTQPYEGRYDALALTIFKLGETKSELVIDYQQLIYLPGEITDIKKWKDKNGKTVYLIARNEESLLALEFKFEQCLQVLVNKK
jgi:enediyne biosynthesis protein E4